MFENLNWVEIVGYVASVVVAVSLMMSSIVNLLWYNLFGDALFSAYGFIINAYPVALLNGFIAFADVYYLIRMYRTSEFFTMQQVNSTSEYLHYFIEFFKDDIANYFPEFTSKKEKTLTYFYLLRNVSIAGIVAGEKANDGYFHVYLDYVSPEYRDLKLGKFFFGNIHEYFKKEKIKGFTAHAFNAEHEKYLLKMGFQFKKTSQNYKSYKLDII